jgi:transposase
LSEIEREKLKAIKKNSPLIKKMHELKEEFHEVFEKSKDIGSGTIKLINWVKRAAAYYKNSVATIKRWLGEIVGYFYNRTTNGIVEGINNKLKLLKRRGFDYRNFDNFKILSLLSWHFLDNFAH